MVLAGAVLPLLILVMLLSGQDAQKWQEKFFNPGKISQAHFLYKDQRMQCQACHQFGEKITNKDCQRCHDQNWFETQAKPFQQSHNYLANRPCLDCHYEHQGYENNITKPFLDKDHQIIPVAKRKKCLLCHFYLSKVAHADNANSNCIMCHTYNTWKRNMMDHEALKPKAVSPLTPYNYCLKCHYPNFHFINTEHPDPILQCRFCHRGPRGRVLPPGY